MKNRKKEEAGVVNLRTLVSDKRIELSSLLDKLASASSEELKAKLQTEIDRQRRALAVLEKELADTEFLVSQDDLDGDGSLNRYDLCPDIPGPILNNGCPLKLYLLDLKLDTIGFASQDKDGAFVFEKLNNNESFVFVI